MYYKNIKNNLIIRCYSTDNSVSRFDHIDDNIKITSGIRNVIVLTIVSTGLIT